MNVGMEKRMGQQGFLHGLIEIVLVIVGVFMLTIVANLPALLLAMFQERGPMVQVLFWAIVIIVSVFAIRAFALKVEPADPCTGDFCAGSYPYNCNSCPTRDKYEERSSSFLPIF